MDEKLIEIEQVEEAVGLKKSSIYALIQAGQFPGGVLLGKRARRWPSSQIQGWIKQQIQQSARA